MFIIPYNAKSKPIILATFVAFILLGLLAAPAAQAQQSQAQRTARSEIEEAEGKRQDDWRFTLSAGALVMPNYPGDDEYLVAPIPNIQIDYKDIVTFSVQGLEITALRAGGFSAGPVARIDFGRDPEGAMPFAVIGGDTDELDGLNEIDITAELGGFVRYQTGKWRLTTEVRQGLNGHEGLVGNVSATYNTQLNWGKTGAFLTIGPALTFADNSYNDAFFSITPEQSIESDLAAFDADGGLNSVGLDLTFVKPINERFSIFAFANYDRLVGDAADNPLVSELGSANQFFGGLFLSYTF